LIAIKLDLSMRRFGPNCDHVLTKRGDQLAQIAAWTGLQFALRITRRPLHESDAAANFGSWFLLLANAGTMQ
jgi:hypothetical protein